MPESILYQVPVLFRSHPSNAPLERELKTAEEILNAELTEPVQIYSSITTNDAGKGFGGLNAWQPLGVAAAAGEDIVYKERLRLLPS